MKNALNDKAIYPSILSITKCIVQDQEPEEALIKSETPRLIMV